MKHALYISISMAAFSGCTFSNAGEGVEIAGLPASNPCEHRSPNIYLWKQDYNAKEAVCERIAPPRGYQRIQVEEGSFADWLRHLPLKPGDARVHLYNGDLKGRQDVHHAIIDIDAGNKDLQQCADAVMRLRGEYLFSKKDLESLHFNYTSGHEVGFKKWSEGYRPQVKGNSVTFAKTAQPDASWNSFRKYMDAIFNYAGTLSLSKEMKKVDDVKSIQPGDVFILGGSPGHAMIVVDVAEKPATGEKMFMLAQSYMPAQDMHIVKNPADASGGPWYSIDFGNDLHTPEWDFTKDQLKRF
jgi:hypothetical protein